MAPSLSKKLQQDVYQIIVKLEDEETFGANQPPVIDSFYVLEHIRRSNSSLARQKRSILEPAIKKALQQRRLDAEDDSEEDDGGRDSGPAASAVGSSSTPRQPADSNLLNRQLVKRWATVQNREKEEMNGRERGSTPVKKRKMSKDGSGAEPESDKPGSLLKSVAVPTRKKAKSRPYKVQGFDNGADNLSLGGIDSLLAKLESELKAFSRPSIGPFDPTSCPTIALSGPQRCGKSAIVRFLAQKWKAPLLVVDCEGLTGTDHDRSARLFVEILDEVRSLGQCVVELSNYDLFWQGDSSSNSSDGIASWQVRSFLHEIRSDLISATPRPTALFATTSHPEAIPEFFLHSELMVAHYQLPMPNEQGRKEMIQAIRKQSFMKSRGLRHDFDYDSASDLTHGYVAGDLVHVMWKALNSSASDGSPLDTAHFKTTLGDYTPILYRQGFTPIPDVTLEMVGGMKAALQVLTRSILRPIRTPDRWYNNNPGGVLLWGPPGCGKTFVAQAIANAARAAFILVNGPELIDKYVGESEKNIRALFQRARTCAPCLIFIDEIDSIAGSRANSNTDSMTRVINTLLVEMDGARKREGVYIIAATNLPGALDPALRRPGRLHRSIYVGMPTLEERVDILNKLLRSKLGSLYREGGTPPDLVQKVAERCEHFTGADIGLLCADAIEETCELGGNEDHHPTWAHWQIALAKAKPSVSMASRDAFEMAQKNDGR